MFKHYLESKSDSSSYNSMINLDKSKQITLPLLEVVHHVVGLKY